MKTVLYVYDVKNLKLLQEELRDFRFLSIAYFIHACNTIEELELMDAKAVDDSVIDITNIIKDDNYYRIFTERYLWTLSENFENVHFCLQSDYLSSFKERLPYFFNKENVNLDFHKVNNDDDDAVGKELKISTPLGLYSYKNPDIAKNLRKEGSLISLSNLVEECEGIVFRYNIDNITRTIEEKEIEYIDLSSMIRTLKLRRDLIFQFEILLHHISKIKNLKFSLENSLVLEANEPFPFTFSKESYISDCA